MQICFPWCSHLINLKLASRIFSLSRKTSRWSDYPVETNGESTEIMSPSRWNTTCERNQQILQNISKYHVIFEGSHKPIFKLHVKVPETRYIRETEYLVKYIVWETISWQPRVSELAIKDTCCANGCRNPSANVIQICKNCYHKLKQSQKTSMEPEHHPLENGKKTSSKLSPKPPWMLLPWI